MKGVNTKILCLIVCCWVSSCITISEQNDRSYSELPAHINQRYGSDIIDNQEMALKFARLVFENKYKYVNFDSLCTFKIESISEDRVWEIVASNPKIYYSRQYTMRINKNTGEILNL